MNPSFVQFAAGVLVFGAVTFWADSRMAKFIIRALKSGACRRIDLPLNTRAYVERIRRLHAKSSHSHENITHDLFVLKAEESCRFWLHVAAWFGVISVLTGGYLFWVFSKYSQIVS